MGRSKGSLSSRQASPMRTVHNPEDSEPGEVKITYMTSEEIAAKYGPPSRKPKGIVICLNDEQVEGGEVDVSGKTKLEIAEAKWPKDKFVKATEGMTLNQITKATELSQYQVVHLRRNMASRIPEGRNGKRLKQLKQLREKWQLLRNRNIR